ncbi:MAG: hypothetical protein P8X42_07620 [Calditrichaceae bacterium]|jgi:hypothetical protein
MNTLFLITLIVEGIFGLGFLFIPAKMLEPYGVILNETATTFARLFGSAVLTFPILLWFARKSDHKKFRKTVVYGLFFYYFVSTIPLLMAQLNRQMNNLGWLIVCLHCILLVWFGYFASKRN